MHADQLTITSPCPVELDEDLSNGEKRFFCDHCDKSVHVLSNMTEREATDFLKSRKGQDTCVTYLHDADGNVRYKTEPELVPLSRLRLPKKRSMVRRAAAAALALAACTPYAEGTEAQVDPVVEHAVAGEIQAIVEPELVPVAGGIAEVDVPVEPTIEPTIKPIDPVVLNPPVVEPTVDEPKFMPVAGGLRPNIEPSIDPLAEVPCDKPVEPVAEVEEEPCDAPPVVDTPKIHKPAVKRGKIKRPMKKDDMVIRGGI